ncbi:MAG: ribonuclease P protein component [gamma proteobacterium symbiont of Bathyaustriella thionipta]|nr:ribonuclease P protein component [gamma proteobacterium symbiont of Bathyaustriella thionipta]MCU7949383.1 ribonuclease P protein component [gamma proteobacterium symbiont of Bathyaustriella thionipta]MCU7952519.1 ribonuclease P protein component [gamma proteobacterium symbiont of Bathyaustriella thionipta]MCU7955973.1 ribonuclease P protein component [gamma proteobacterium symbiont of Bathyaustriella thionipta]
MSESKKNPEQQFSRTQRLLLPSDYKYVFNQSIRSSDKLLTILAKKNFTLSKPRLGLAVAKKSVKTAVHRNRIKRLCREFFRLNQSKFVCADYVILVRNGIDKVDNSAITQSLAKQFNYLRKKLAEK